MQYKVATDKLNSSQAVFTIICVAACFPFVTLQADGEKKNVQFLHSKHKRGILDPLVDWKN